MPVKVKLKKKKGLLSRYAFAHDLIMKVGGLNNEGKLNKIIDDRVEFVNKTAEEKGFNETQLTNELIKILVPVIAVLRWGNPDEEAFQKLLTKYTNSPVAHLNKPTTGDIPEIQSLLAELKDNAVAQIGEKPGFQDHVTTYYKRTINNKTSNVTLADNEYLQFISDQYALTTKKTEEKVQTNKIDNQTNVTIESTFEPIEFETPAAEEVKKENFTSTGNINRPLNTSYSAPKIESTLNYFDKLRLQFLKSEILSGITNPKLQEATKNEITDKVISAYNSKSADVYTQFLNNTEEKINSINSNLLAEVKHEATTEKDDEIELDIETSPDDDYVKPSLITNKSDIESSIEKFKLLGDINKKLNTDLFEKIIFSDRSDITQIKTLNKSNLQNFVNQFSSMNELTPGALNNYKTIINNLRDDHYIKDQNNAVEQLFARIVIPNLLPRNVNSDDIHYKYSDLINETINLATQKNPYALVIFKDAVSAYNTNKEWSEVFATAAKKYAPEKNTEEQPAIKQNATFTADTIKGKPDFEGIEDTLDTMLGNQKKATPETNKTKETKTEETKSEVADLYTQIIAAAIKINLPNQAGLDSAKAFVESRLNDGIKEVKQTNPEHEVSEEDKDYLRSQIFASLTEKIKQARIEALQKVLQEEIAKNSPEKALVDLQNEINQLQNEIQTIKNKAQELKQQFQNPNKDHHKGNVADLYNSLIELERKKNESFTPHSRTSTSQTNIKRQTVSQTITQPKEALFQEHINALINQVANNFIDPFKQTVKDNLSKQSQPLNLIIVKKINPSPDNKIDNEDVKPIADILFQFIKTPLLSGDSYKFIPKELGLTDIGNKIDTLTGTLLSLQKQYKSSYLTNQNVKQTSTISSPPPQPEPTRDDTNTKLKDEITQLIQEIKNDDTYSSEIKIGTDSVAKKDCANAKDHYILALQNANEKLKLISTLESKLSNLPVSPSTTAFTILHSQELSPLRSQWNNNIADLNKLTAKLQSLITLKIELEASKSDPAKHLPKLISIINLEKEINEISLQDVPSSFTKQQIIIQALNNFNELDSKVIEESAYQNALEHTIEIIRDNDDDKQFVVELVDLQTKLAAIKEAKNKLAELEDKLDDLTQLLQTQYKPGGGLTKESIEELKIQFQNDIKNEVSEIKDLNLNKNISKLDLMLSIALELKDIVNQFPNHISSQEITTSSIKSSNEFLTKAKQYLIDNQLAVRELQPNIDKLLSDIENNITQRTQNQNNLFSEAKLTIEALERDSKLLDPTNPNFAANYQRIGINTAQHENFEEKFNKSFSNLETGSPEQLISKNLANLITQQAQRITDLYKDELNKSNQILMENNSLEKMNNFPIALKQIHFEIFDPADRDKFYDEFKKIILSLAIKIEDETNNKINNASITSSADLGKLDSVWEEYERNLGVLNQSITHFNKLASTWKKETLPPALADTNIATNITQIKIKWQSVADQINSINNEFKVANDALYKIGEGMDNTYDVTPNKIPDLLTQLITQENSIKTRTLIAINLLPDSAPEKANLKIQADNFNKAANHLKNALGKINDLYTIFQDLKVNIHTEVNLGTLETKTNTLLNELKGYHDQLDDSPAKTKISNIINKIKNTPIDNLIVLHRAKLKHIETLNGLNSDLSKISGLDDALKFSGHKTFFDETESKINSAGYNSQINFSDLEQKKIEVNNQKQDLQNFYDRHFKNTEQNLLLRISMYQTNLTEFKNDLTTKDNTVLTLSADALKNELETIENDYTKLVTIQDVYKTPPSTIDVVTRLTELGNKLKIDDNKKLLTDYRSILPHVSALNEIQNHTANISSLTLEQINIDLIILNDTNTVLEGKKSDPNVTDEVKNFIATNLQAVMIKIPQDEFTTKVLGILNNDFDKESKAHTQNNTNFGNPAYDIKKIHNETKQTLERINALITKYKVLEPSKYGDDKGIQNKLNELKTLQTQSQNLYDQARKKYGSTLTDLNFNPLISEHSAALRQHLTTTVEDHIQQVAQATTLKSNLYGTTSRAANQHALENFSKMVPEIKAEQTATKLLGLENTRQDAINKLGDRIDFINEEIAGLDKDTHKNEIDKLEREHIRLTNQQKELLKFKQLQNDTQALHAERCVRQFGSAFKVVKQSQVAAAFSEMDKQLGIKHTSSNEAKRDPDSITTGTPNDYLHLTDHIKNGEVRVGTIITRDAPYNYKLSPEDNEIRFQEHASKTAARIQQSHDPRNNTISSKLQIPNELRYEEIFANAMLRKIDLDSLKFNNNAVLEKQLGTARGMASPHKEKEIKRILVEYFTPLIKSSAQQIAGGTATEITESVLKDFLMKKTGKYEDVTFKINFGLPGDNLFFRHSMLAEELNNAKKRESRPDQLLKMAAAEVDNFLLANGQDPNKPGEFTQAVLGKAFSKEYAEMRVNYCIAKGIPYIDNSGYRLSIDKKRTTLSSVLATREHGVLRTAATYAVVSGLSWLGNKVGLVDQANKKIEETLELNFKHFMQSHPREENPREAWLRSDLASHFNPEIIKRMGFMKVLGFTRPSAMKFNPEVKRNVHVTRDSKGETKSNVPRTAAEEKTRLDASAQSLEQKKTEYRNNLAEINKKQGELEKLFTDYLGETKGDELLANKDTVLSNINAKFKELADSYHTIREDYKKQIATLAGAGSPEIDAILKAINKIDAKKPTGTDDVSKAQAAVYDAEIRVKIAEFQQQLINKFLTLNKEVQSTTSAANSILAKQTGYEAELRALNADIKSKKGILAQAQFDAALAQYETKLEKLTRSMPTVITANTIENSKAALQEVLDLESDLRKKAKAVPNPKNAVDKVTELFKQTAIIKDEQSKLKKLYKQNPTLQEDEHIKVNLLEQEAANAKQFNAVFAARNLISLIDDPNQPTRNARLAAIPGEITQHYETAFNKAKTNLDDELKAISDNNQLIAAPFDGKNSVAPSNDGISDLIKTLKTKAENLDKNKNDHAKVNEIKHITNAARALKDSFTEIKKTYDNISNINLTLPPGFSADQRQARTDQAIKLNYMQYQKLAAKQTQILNQMKRLDPAPDITAINTINTNIYEAAKNNLLIPLNDLLKNSTDEIKNIDANIPTISVKTTILKELIQQEKDLKAFAPEAEQKNHKTLSTNLKAILNDLKTNFSEADKLQKLATKADDRQAIYLQELKIKYLEQNELYSKLQNNLDPKKALINNSEEIKTCHANIFTAEKNLLNAKIDAAFAPLNTIVASAINHVNESKPTQFDLPPIDSKVLNQIEKQIQKVISLIPEDEKPKGQALLDAASQAKILFNNYKKLEKPYERYLDLQSHFQSNPEEYKQYQHHQIVKVNELMLSLIDMKQAMDGNDRQNERLPLLNQINASGNAISTLQDTIDAKIAAAELEPLSAIEPEHSQNSMMRERDEYEAEDYADFHSELEVDAHVEHDNEEENNTDFEEEEEKEEKLNIKISNTPPLTPRGSIISPHAANNSAADEKINKPLNNQNPLSQTQQDINTLNYAKENVAKLEEKANEARSLIRTIEPLGWFDSEKVLLTKIENLNKLLEQIVLINNNLFTLAPYSNTIALKVKSPALHSLGGRFELLFPQGYSSEIPSITAQLIVIKDLERTSGKLDKKKLNKLVGDIRSFGGQLTALTQDTPGIDSYPTKISVCNEANSLIDDKLRSLNSLNSNKPNNSSVEESKVRDNDNEISIIRDAPHSYSSRSSISGDRRSPFSLDENLIGQNGKSNEKSNDIAVSNEDNNINRPKGRHG